MRRNTELEKRPPWIEEKQTILPLMTALFVDGFTASDWPVGYNVPCRPPVIEKQQIRIFRLPLVCEAPDPTHLKTPFAQGIAFKEDSRKHRAMEASGTGASIIHTLISGISLHYNNLLMSIMGNVTLMHLELKEGRAGGYMAEMERLVRIGSFLIHMVLGYLNESGTEAKRMRLHQLLKEMKAEIPGALCADDLQKMEAKLQWASCLQNPRLIAGNSARVMEILFQEFHFLCQQTGALKISIKGIRDALNRMHALVVRGLALTRQLRFYSGDFKPRMTRIKMAPLVNKILTQLCEQHPQLSLNFETIRPLPMVLADRQLIEFVMQEVLGHAMQNLLPSARVAVALRGFREEPAVERCGVHTANDYVVLTIQNNAPAMTPEIQKRIFEPFFKLPGNGHTGIGLAATIGILKAHDGYIQLQSLPASGNTFKIYLPVQNAAQVSQKGCSEAI